MKILKILGLLNVIVIITLSQSLILIHANENNEEGTVTSWFDWKVKHLNNENQKKIIEYFEKINPFFEKAKETEYTTKASRWGHPNPDEALKIIDYSIKEVKKIKSPKPCLKYYSITLKALQDIKNYQIERLRAGTDEKFEARREQDQAYEIKLRNAQLEELKLEEERNKEYFKILRKIGFYDNVLNEMVNLKLITKEEKEKVGK